MWVKFCINPFWQLVKLGAKVKTTSNYVLYFLGWQCNKPTLWIECLHFLFVGVLGLLNQGLGDQSCPNQMIYKSLKISHWKFTKINLFCIRCGHLTSWDWKFPKLTFDHSNHHLQRPTKWCEIGKLDMTLKMVCV